MFSTLSANLNPLPMAVEVMRASLRQHNALTQRQLSAIGQLVRAAGDQAGARVAGTLAAPLLAPQAQAATAITDGMLDIARLALDSHARSAGDVLSWWERRLGGAASKSTAVEASVASAPATPKATRTSSAEPVSRVASPSPAAKSAAKPTTSRKTRASTRTAAAKATAARVSPTSKPVTGSTAASKAGASRKQTAAVKKTASVATRKSTGAKPATRGSKRSTR